MRGQALVCIILGTFYAVSLGLVGLNFGALIGMTAGILSFIPYVGSLTGLILSGNNLYGWDFTNQNLTNASFVGSYLDEVSIAGATVRGVRSEHGRVRGVGRKRGSTHRLDGDLAHEAGASPARR